MKKSLALILGLCIFLSACTAGNPTESIGDPTTTPPTSSQTTATTAPAETGGADETVEPSKPDSTQPSDSSGPTEATRPAATVPSNKEDTDHPKQTEPKETKPPVNTSQPTTPPETQPEETEPPTTQPTVTDPTTSQETGPTTPSETKPDDSNPQQENVDAYEIAAQANAYAVSLGFVIDGSLNKGNSGYYSPDYRPIRSNDVGISAAKDLVSATKNQLNSRFADGFSTTLVESIYGLVRVNCVVEYSHTDELGNWYYIYVFYG